MNGVKEYIFPVYDVDADEFKEYIGFIRTKPELIRCNDCKYNPKWSWVGCPMAGCMSRTDEWYCPKAEPKDNEE